MIDLKQKIDDHYLNNISFFDFFNNLLIAMAA